MIQKVLFIHTAYRYKGGEESVVDAEINLLRSKGVDVQLLIFENPVNWIKSIWIFLISVFNIFSYIKTIKAINRFQPDVIHVHNWHFTASPAVFWAARFKKIPVVHSLHNYRLICPSGILFFNDKLFLDSLYQKFPWNAVLKKVYRNSSSQTFWLAFILWIHDKLGTWKNIDKYIVMTEFARERMLIAKRNWKPEQFVIKPNFVEPIITDGEKQKSDDFFYIGRHSKEKGINVLLDAAAESDFRLKMIGNGPLKPDVVHLADSKPERIAYLGYVDEATKYSTLQNCAALILPSVCYEGMPVTIIEAFSLGVPVIASNLGAMSSMIQDGYTGLLFEPGNPQSLVECVQKWLSFTEEQKEEIRKNARQTFEEQYTAEKNYLQLISIYQSVRG